MATASGLGSPKSRKVTPNNSFNPNPLRSTNNVADKACHVVGSTTQVGLTQALAPMGEINVDFIAKDPWQMVLVEEGPWDDVSAHLATLQNRLYSCLDAVIDGQLAEQFPESRGQPITLRVDCYGVPRAETEEFFSRFSSSALQLPDYEASLASSPHVSSIYFAINFAGNGC